VNLTIFQVSYHLKGYCDMSHKPDLKGWSHENLLCFYWYRWKAKNVLHLFIPSISYNRFHVEFSIIRCSAVFFFC
jgi:hypothetical protein